MAITTRASIFSNIAKGLGNQLVMMGAATGTTTAAAAASGHLTMQLNANVIGTTYPNTLVGFPVTPSPPNELLALAMQADANSPGPCWLAYFYRFGTQVLTSTGDQFTRDSWTAPLLRTQFGVASQPVTLLPFIYVTTALTTTAASLVLKTAAGGTGYVNQDGNNVVGAKTFTFPSATTAVQSAFVPMMEDGDSGVRDIAAIQTTVAAGAGAASVWGVELFCPAGVVIANRLNFHDPLFGGLGVSNINPAVVTSGSLTAAFLGFCTMITSNRTMMVNLVTVLNA